MSVMGISIKKRAVQFQDKLQEHADQIAKLDVENLQILDDMKNNARHNSLPQVNAALDLEVKTSRHQLFEPTKEFQKLNEAKWNEVHKTIQDALSRGSREKHISQKRFDEIQEHFDSLHERAMSIATKPTPQRWSLMLQINDDDVLDG